MPAYRYRAATSSGRIAQGSLAAANERELSQNLGASGLHLIEARAKNGNTAARFFLTKHLLPRALARFAAQMRELLQAGISLPEALQDLADAAENAAMRDALTDILRAINHGSAISAAFQRHARLFPEIFTTILAAGEHSGDLAATFGYLAAWAESRAASIEQTQRAIRYPLFLLLVAGGVVSFMMTMVVPPIIEFLHSIDGELPLMTKLLIAATDFFTAYAWILPVLAALCFALMPLLRRMSSQAAGWIDALLLRLPALGPLWRTMALARFTRSFAILFQSHLGIPECLKNAGLTLNNEALRAALLRTERNLNAGQSLSLALAELLPTSALRMLRVGERSGNLGAALIRIADAYDRDTAEATERLLGSLEPTLTLLVGGVLAWIVLAVLGPIYGNLPQAGGM